MSPTFMFSLDCINSISDTVSYYTYSAYFAAPSFLSALTRISENILVAACQT